jgi:hypothetical protein
LILGIKYAANAQDQTDCITTIESGKGYNGATYIKVSFLSLEGVADDLDYIKYLGHSYKVTRTTAIDRKMYKFSVHLPKPPPTNFYIFAGGNKLKCTVKSRKHGS